MRDLNRAPLIVLVWRVLAVVAAFGMLPRACAQGVSPFAFTQAAAPVTTFDATLNGMVAPNGADTLAWFEWGTNSSYGQTTAPVSVGNGFTVMRVSAGITNLPPFSTFRCRLVVSNTLGVFHAAAVPFTSGQRVTVWGSTSSGQMPVAAGLSNAVNASAGHFHSIALTADGRVVGWGDNSTGQNNVPPNLGSVAAVSAGGYHNLALKTDGTVVAWGKNDSGQTNVPPTLSNVVAVSGGYDHSLALTADGTVIAWGSNSGGQTNVPAGLSNVVAVAAGGFHSLALKADGTVAVWGEPWSGQTNVPAGLSNAVAVAAGAWSSFAIKADATAVTWPDDPVFPANLGTVLAVDGGTYHAVALRSDGTVAAWGIDYVGITNVPAGLSNVAAVSAGGYHSLALGNLPPQALGPHLSGVAGQDLAITLAGTDLNNDALSFRITTLPATGTLYQWTPGGRGAVIAVPGTTLEDPGRRVILAQPIAANDSFAFLVNDGLQDSTPATVLVDTVPARAFTHRPQPAGVSSVTLAGMVLAAAPTQVWFEWGAAGGYSQATAPVSLAGDGSLVYVTNLLTGLAERANYQCRLVASNQFGVSYGMAVLFTTGRRVYGWGSNNNGQTNTPSNLTNAVFAACGWYSSLAITADRTPVTWGSPGLTPPAGLSNVVDMAGGYNHCLALKSDGTVVAWGSNAYDQTNAPAGLSNVVDVSAAYVHSLALKADGTLALWGQIAGTGQTNPPAGLSNVVAIAGGLFYDIALKADGTVVAWGQDNGGGETIIPADLMNVVALAAGDYHCLALRADGTVAAWGRNSSGQATVPAGLSNVVAIAAGGSQSLALKADGAIVAWGSVTTAKGNVVAGLTNVVFIANGYTHGLALGNLTPQVKAQNCSGLAGQDVTITLQGSDPDGDPLQYRLTSLPASGDLYQWTAAGRGSPITTNNTWVEDPGGRVIYAHSLPVSASFTFLANDGLVDSSNATVSVTIFPAWACTLPSRPAGTSAALLCGVAAAASPTKVWFEWGAAGGYGQRTADTVLPADGKLTQVYALAANLVVRVNYQCRLVASNAFGVTYGAPVLFTTGRKVVAWGRNNFNQTNVPLWLSNVVSAAAGVNHNLALKSDGTVAAWGFGAGGETNVPPGLANIVAVDAGANHSLALKADGTVAVWGLGNLGQTNVPAGLSNVVAVAAGYYHSLALRSDGTVAAWGANTFDQFPSGQTNVPPGLSNVVSVAAGGGHNLALKADGTVVAWGYNSSGQTNVPAAVSNVVAVAAGRNHSLALKANGTVVGWGNNRGGQTTIPATVSNIVALAAGESHSLVLRADGWATAWGDNFYGQATIPPTLSNTVALSGGGFHNLALANLPPQAQSQTNVGVVARDLTLALPATDPNYDALTYRVASLPAAGKLYQWAFGGRGAPITTPNTTVADLQGRVVFAPESTLAGWPYTTFTFIANDGEADSVPAAVTVDLIAPFVIDVSSLAVGTNGSFSFTFAGDTNATYRVWASTNLATWGILGTATFSPPDLFNFTDTAATNWPQCFYRVTCP